MCPKIHDLFGHLQTTGYFEYDHKIRRQFSQTSFFNMFFNIPVDLRGRTSFFASSELPFHPPIGEGKTEEVSVEDALKDKKAKKCLGGREPKSWAISNRKITINHLGQFSGFIMIWIGYRSRSLTPKNCLIINIISFQTCKCLTNFEIPLVQFLTPYPFTVSFFVFFLKLCFPGRMKRGLCQKYSTRCANGLQVPPPPTSSPITSVESSPGRCSRGSEL